AAARLSTAGQLTTGATSSAAIGLIHHHLRHAEPDTQPRAAEQPGPTSSAAVAALRHAFAGTHHRLARCELLVRTDHADRPHVRLVRVQPLQVLRILFVDRNFEITEPDDLHTVARHM